MAYKTKLNPFTIFVFSLSIQKSSTCYIQNNDFDVLQQCEQSTKIDVNIGQTAELFIKAAHCQITGKQPTTTITNRELGKLQNLPYWRRIDTIRTFCAENGRENDCTLDYGNYWSQPEPYLYNQCKKKAGRPDLGAIFMFFFRCGSGITNCGKDWANTHASGMFNRSSLYGFGSQTYGWYNASNVGFWSRELQDAQYAGLQFILANVYGKDINDNPTILQNINIALDSTGGALKAALFDDTWGYPQLFDPVPSMNEVQATAKKFYDSKWRRWFMVIKKSHWYYIGERPLVYFYNSGRVGPQDKGAAVVEEMKRLFEKDFGVRPFVVQDRGFPPDGNTDISFQWDPLGEPDRVSITSKNGFKLLHFLAKFDAMGRSNPGQIARNVTNWSSSSPDKNYRVIKDEKLLQKALQLGANTNLISFGTWNDLGEGTGVGRNYDYSIKGNSVSPLYFMDVIRAIQCQ